MEVLGLLSCFSTAVQYLRTQWTNVHQLCGKVFSWQEHNLPVYMSTNLSPPSSDWSDSVFLLGEAFFLFSKWKRAHCVFVVRAWEHGCFSESITGFCVGNEAAVFLNSSFKLEPATPVLHWVENKFLHISCARGRSVGRTKVGIVCHKDVITVSPEPEECRGDTVWVSRGRRSFPSGMWEQAKQSMQWPTDPVFSVGGWTGAIS